MVKSLILLKKWVTWSNAEKSIVVASRKEPKVLKMKMQR